MSKGGYTLIDVLPDQRWLASDPESCTRFLEYVRANFREIVPEIPAECELDLCASGKPHNVGLRPLLGLYAPSNVLEKVPDRSYLFDVVSAWAANLSDAELHAILEETTKPTWAELQKLDVYPSR